VKKIVPVMLLLAAIFLVPSHSHPSTLEAVHISLIEGDVQIKTEDTHEWVVAAINMPLMDGDRIWIPEGGRTELQLSDGTYVRLDGNSSLEILESERDFFYFYLTTGYIYVNFRGLKGSLIQIDTPVSSINVSERSTFRIDVSDDGVTDISVLRGTVHAESRFGSTAVSEGNTLYLRGNDYADLHPLNPPDEWEEWNRGRDSTLYERRYSSSYLPGELSVYSNDFVRYGKWVHVREYGHVWKPTVVVSVGWAPYRHGRWVWIAGDYVWVSYEPWGWVPYHYGRWIFSVSFGWCWVPPLRGAVYWGPGFVGWVYTPEYVAWVPLAPREIYYGYGYFGPYSVNIININVNKHVVKKVYKNVFVEKAVSVIHRKTFLGGRSVKLKLKENPFIKNRIHAGRPKIRPERTTTMPIIKEIPGNKLPPPRIRDKQVKKIKERPFVRERVDTVKRLRKGKKLVDRKIERPGEYRLTLERGRKAFRKRISMVKRDVKRTVEHGKKVVRWMNTPGGHRDQVRKDINSHRKYKVPAERLIARDTNRRLPTERKIEKPFRCKESVDRRTKTFSKKRAPVERMIGRSRTHRTVEKETR